MNGKYTKEECDNMKIKMGMTRIVIILKHYVIKVPNFLSFWRFIYGFISNYTEYVTYKIYAEDKINPDMPLANVIYGNMYGLILIMERVDIFDDEEWNELYSTIEQYYKDSPYYELIIDDFKPSNWGKRKDGTIVKIDYGEYPSRNIMCWHEYKQTGFFKRKKS